jgi:outer membrane biosynthesis protein TonB
MRGSLTISAIVHLVALGMCLVAFAAEPLEAPATPTMAVNTISVKEFTELTKGVKDTPKLKVDDIKPVADKIDTPKPVDEVAPKPVDKKPEIKTDTSAKQQPKPDNKPDPKPDPKPADKPAKAKPPDYKPDQIADLLKQKDAAKQPKPDDKASPDTPPRDSPQFNADQVAALLDKRAPQRQVAAAETLNNHPDLGTSTGAAAQLSQSEIDALRARIGSCWSPPAGITASTKIYVVLRVLFKPDASMSREPVLVEGTASALGPALAESAKRALLMCQPFTMLKPEHYDQWKDLELKFDPQELLGG